jgi:hypothetical protein
MEIQARVGVPRVVKFNAVITIWLVLATHLLPVIKESEPISSVINREMKETSTTKVSVLMI